MGLLRILNDFYRDINQCLNLKKGKHSFVNQQKKQRVYNLLRKKSHKKARRRRSQLLKLLSRLKKSDRTYFGRIWSSA